MDIALLSKMIGELVPYHSVIGLPGLGSFVVEDIPAAFADRGYTINPPYKSLSFIQECSDDSAIVNYYAECNRISVESSRAILTDYLSQLNDLISRKKAVSFPGLGRLRSTSDNRIFFVPDENLAIFPYGLPLDPISLKNHVETDEEIDIAVRNLSSILSARPAPIPDVAPETEEFAYPVFDDSLKSVEETRPIATSESETGTVLSATERQELENLHDEETNHRKTRTLLYVVLSILVLLVVALCTFLVLVEVNPDFIDSILYTPEELEIINW